MKLKKPKKKREKRKSILPTRPDSSQSDIWDELGDGFYIIFLTIVLLIALFVPSSKNHTSTPISNQSSTHTSSKKSGRYKNIRIPMPTS